MSSKKFLIPVTLLVALLSGVAVIHAAPKAGPWPRWEANDPSSTIPVDHGPWDRFLKKYLVTDDPSGVNKVRYGSVTAEDKKLLEEYLTALHDVRVSALSRPEQEAYWINMYNALTVKVVLDYYPVKSILDIGISPGLFSKGPWGAKLLRIEGEEISLDDIEHRILRPIWKDNRVHYAVNCASMSCPNLQPQAFTARNIDELLDRGARDYINSPRGVRFDRGGLILSSIYDWYQADFGATEVSVIQHLSHYAVDPLAQKLKGYRGKIDYQYDWRLNEASNEE